MCWLVSRLPESHFWSSSGNALNLLEAYCEPPTVCMVPETHTAGRCLIKNKLVTVWISLNLSFLSRKTKGIGSEDFEGLSRLWNHTMGLTRIILSVSRVWPSENRSDCDRLAPGIGSTGSPYRGPREKVPRGHLWLYATQRYSLKFLFVQPEKAEAFFGIKFLFWFGSSEGGTVWYIKTYFIITCMSMIQDKNGEPKLNQPTQRTKIFFSLAWWNRVGQGGEQGEGCGQIFLKLNSDSTWQQGALCTPQI